MSLTSHKQFGYIEAGTFHPLVTVPDDTAERVIDAIRDATAERAGGREQPVEVRVDQDLYEKHRAKNPKAKPLGDYDTFPSIMKLNAHMGYGSNYVGIRYAQAKRDGKDEVTIQGVTIKKFRGD
jgi:hypothetical protein